MKKVSLTPLFKNIFIVLFLFIAIIFLFSSLYNSPSQAPTSVSLTDLANKINASEVSSIIVSGDTINATLKDDSIITTQKEGETGLLESLRSYGVSSEQIASVPLTVKDESGLAFWLGILVPTILPIILIGFFFWWMFRQARAGANQAMSFGKSNVRLSSPFKGKVTFADVAGLAESKQELTEVVDFLKNPKKYSDLGAQIPRGVLLMGPPGTGKTLLARAVAGEAGVPFFHLSASEFVEMFVGVGASRTRDAFTTAKRAAPAILFIDEIDAIGRERGAGLGGGHDEREQTLNQILVEMDGFEKDTRLVVLAATNRPDVLDAALLRPGRFDRRVILDLPDIEDREQILQIHSRNKPLAKNIDLRSVAVRTPGFSGADLENLMNEAAILAARNGKKEIGQLDLFTSIEKVLLGPERRSHIFSTEEKELTAYHEAGHALVAAGIEHADPVHKVSIISRGRAGGYTIKLPDKERYLRTRKQFIADLAVMFGGYSAEEIVYKDLSTGASNDLAIASDTARKLVTKYGMGKFGPLTFGKTQELVFLGKEMTTERNYSEATAQEIDKEVERFIQYGYTLAKKIIKKHRKVLNALAEALVKKETLERDDFEAIIKKFKVEPMAV